MPALLLFVALILAGPAAAAPTVTCHCFRDREYEPARPAGADPYALATARNSLLAAAFGLEKGDVVRALMSGASPEDLWVSHWAAARLGGDAKALRAEREEKGGWGQALAGADLARLGSGFAGTLRAGGSDASLADAAVDEVLVSRLGVSAADLKALRQGGAGSPEVILACLLRKRLGTPAPDLAARVKRGKATWGALLREAGLAPKDVEGELRRSLR